MTTEIHIHEADNERAFDDMWRAIELLEDHIEKIRLEIEKLKAVKQ